MQCGENLTTGYTTATETMTVYKLAIVLFLRLLVVDTYRSCSN